MNHERSELTSDNGFWIRAILYGGIGLLFRLRGQNLAALTILGPLAEKALGTTMEEVFAEWQRQQQEKERQERMRQLLDDWASSIKQIVLQANRSTRTTSTLSTLESPMTDKDRKWLKIIVHPSVVLIIGKRGSGKSGLGYRLLELFRYRLTPYVLGIPVEAQKLLPDWIGVATTLDEIPKDSIVLVDEAYIPYHSRESLKMQSTEMSRIVNLSRQRNQTLIFVTQEARQVDKNITSQANVIVFKEPAMLQVRFDRPELNDIATQAKLAFSKIGGDKRTWSYVYSPDVDFMGLLENSLPTFWSLELSHAFAFAEPLPGRRLAKKITKGDRKSKAKELRQNGYSYRQIASILGINEATAYNYVNDYPYWHKSS